MASILDLYGIKEVANVTFYEVDTNKPVLYLDSLKVTTIEETAQQTSAAGGQGNSPLIVWDYGKEINLTVEDALFSMKSMALMHDSEGKLEHTSSVVRSAKFTANASASAAVPSSIPNNATIYDENGATVTLANIANGKTYLATWIKSIAGEESNTITIKADEFPGTYKVVGDTMARGTDGKDSFFQFVIPRAKMSFDKTITMQAEGDPSTFSMNLKVLRPDDGQLMKLIKY